MCGASDAWDQRSARGGVAQDLALQLISAFRGRCGRADLDLNRAHRAPVLRRNVRHVLSSNGTVDAWGLTRGS